MSFVVSKANSLRFYEVVAATTLPTFDNVKSGDESQPFGQVMDYCQKFTTGETIQTQVNTDYDTLVAKVYEEDGTLNSTPAITDLGNDYLEFDIDMSALSGKYYVELTGTDAVDPTVIYRSEPFEVASEWDYHIKIQYTNFETAYNIDYTNNPIDNILWIPAQHKDYNPSGTIDVYDNQGRTTKLEEESGRNLEFVTDFIPRYLAEKITTALAHNEVLFNDVEFTTSKKPDVEPNASNQVSLTVITTQVEVIGLTTDDQGFDGGGGAVSTDDVKPLALSGVTGAQTVTIDINFCITAIIINLASGASATVKAGWSVGGSDIMSLKTITQTNRKTYNIDFAPPAAGNTTIYFTIVGVGATVDINTVTIRYKEDTP